MARAISVEILGDSSSLERSFRRANASASGFSKQMGSVSKRSSIGIRGIAAGVGVGLLGGAGVVHAFTSTINKAAQFERSMNVLQAVSGATGAQMRKMSATAIRLGGDITLPATSAKDAADAMLELSKGGLSVKESMEAARGTLQLSSAAQVTVAEAAVITARALNAFALEGTKATEVADILANAANVSTGEITDFALGLQQASASAHQAGLSLEDTATALALMANKGIVGSDAGTSIKTMLARLVPQTAKAHKEFRKLGLSFSDSNGNLLPLRQQIIQFNDALSRLTPVQRQQAVNTIFGSDAQRAANIILGSGVAAYDKMHKAITTQGSAARIAAAQNKGFAGAMDGLKSAIETVQIELGTQLLPVLTKNVKILSAWLSKTKNQKLIMQDFRQIIATVSGVLRTLRAIIIQVNRVTGSLGNTVKALIAIFIVFKGLKMAKTVSGVASSFLVMGRNAGVAAKRTRAAALSARTLSTSLVGKAGLVGAAGVAAFAITTLILKATGLDKKLRSAGGAAFDLATKLGLANDAGKQFEGKTILGQKETKFLRAQAAKLEAGGLTPQKAAAKLAVSHPKVALRDLQVLSGVFGAKPTAPTVVHYHGDIHVGAKNTRELEAELAKRARSRTHTRRGK